MKNTLLALLSGVLLSLSWPTYGFAGLLFVAFIPILIVVENIYDNKNNKSKRQGLKVFAYSYVSFVIWNFVTTWWLHYADFYAGLFAVTANAALMALVMRLYLYVKKKAGNHLGLMFLPAIWMGFEKLHLYWDLSWPWLNLGNGFAEYYKWVQWYEYTGAFGGTFWVWIVNITLFSGIYKYIITKNKHVIVPHLLRATLFIVAPIIFSYYLYNNYEEKGEKTQMVVLQPNLDPYGEKFSFGNDLLSKQLTDLAESKITKNTSFVLGPETSLPDGMESKYFSNSSSIQNIKYFIGNHKNTSFLTGATLVRRYYNKEDAAETANVTRNGKMWYDMYNSALVVNSSDSIEVYNKSKLVVGVEHMPFRSVIKPLLGDFIINLGGTIGTHATQKERSVFVNAKYRINVAPVICYESVYGEFVTDYVKNGANILAVITNDGWWNDSEGHRQHLSFSRLRSIENRRSVARSANTGISAFVNQKGDIISSLTYGDKGALLGEIRANNELTIYTQFGDYIARIAIFIAAIIFIYTITIRKKSMVF